MHSFKLTALSVFAGAVASTVLGMIARPAGATLIYSNVTDFGEQAFEQGSASAVGSPAVYYTPLLSDDIGPIAGSAGRAVDSVTFSIANFNSVTLTTAPILSFYDSNGTDEGPGTLLDSIKLSPISMPGDDVDLFTVNSNASGGFFRIPSDTSFFWAGEAFTNGDGSTATPADLANFGQALFDPPTVGSSQDDFFITTKTTSFTTGNPSGEFQNFGGSPVGNFGWAFSATAVPEPASLGIIGLLSAGLLSRRRAAVKSI
jgi:hypothetical protein